MTYSQAKQMVIEVKKIVKENGTHEAFEKLFPGQDHAHLALIHDNPMLLDSDPKFQMFMKLSVRESCR